MPDLPDPPLPSEPPELDRWATLLATYFEGDSSQEPTAELALELETQPEFRRLFVDVAMQRVPLRRVCQESFELPADASPARISKPTRFAALSWLDGKSATRPGAAVWATLAAGLLFAAYIVGISWNMLGREAADRRLQAEGGKQEAQDPTDYSLKPKASSAVATITDTADVEWSVDESLRDSQGNQPASTASRRDAATKVAPGEPLSINSGLVEFKLKQGVTLLIEGPADWTIDGNNNATLKRGKLVAKVPQQAIGFTLETPTAKIVDLGTEFGVEVGSGGVPQVHVLKGLVDVHALRKGTTSPPIRLQAGESVRIDADGRQSPLEPADGRKFKQLAERSAPLARKRSLATRLIDLSKAAVASQSSEYSPAANAIDGNPETYSHTSLSEDRSPWWQVDLGEMREVASVVVVNRHVTGKARLRNITIKLLADDGVTEVATSPLLNPGNKDWGGVRDDHVGPTQLHHDFRSRAGEPVAARFVRVARTPKEEDRDDSDRGNPVLTIGEVQVFEPTNRD